MDRTEGIYSAIGQEMSNPLQQWWLSFADPTLPEGDQFLGVVIVEAPGFILATLLCHKLGINPGGEVAGWPTDGIDEKWVNRLLTKDEIKEMP